MTFYNWFLWSALLIITLEEATGADDAYNTIHKDGSYEFGYNNPDSYHYADANRNNVVKGEFGGRNPGTGTFDSTVYTAGPRGYRPRGKNIARKYDLNQAGPRPVGSPDDPYYDPYEDPSYNFGFRTRTYNRQENANRVGDVTGKYSYVDDVGERHNVEFIAGKNTGFHVKTPFPDSNPRAYGPLYFNGRGKPIPRGRTSIQRGLDGSYRFVSAGPDQRRTETSDATGHVRGSYTYLDDKGVQHSVHYIAGPETGYRVLKTVKGPHLPTVFPFGRPEIVPPDFYDFGKDTDVFDTAASGHIRPGGSKPIPTGVGSDKDDFGKDKDKDQDEFSFGNKRPVKPSRKPPTPAFGGVGDADFGGPGDGNDDTDDFGDLFGGGGAATGTGGGSTAGTGPGSSGSGNIGGIGSSSGGTGGVGASSTTPRPTKPTVGQGLLKPDKSSAEDDGSYKPSSGEDGSYKPYKPLPTRPSFGNLPRPGGLGSTVAPSVPTGSGTRPSGSPTVGGGSNEVNDNDFSLFGSETGNPRPPFGSRPIIHVGATDESCKKCAGTIVTNVGDKLFTVPPGVSVRAHVQAIDLIPISPSVPSPSEQYKADTSLRTEQLNEASNQIVGTTTTERNSEEVVTEIATTTTLVPNT